MIRYPGTGRPDPLPCRKAPCRSVHPRAGRSLGVGPDDMLSVSNSSPCNICERKVCFGEIRRMGLDGSDAWPILTGMGNTVGFDWNPKTGNLRFTDPELSRRCDEFTDPVVLLGAHTPPPGNAIPSGGHVRRRPQGADLHRQAWSVEPPRQGRRRGRGRLSGRRHRHRPDRALPDRLHRGQRICRPYGQCGDDARRRPSGARRLERCDLARQPR